MWFQINYYNVVIIAKNFIVDDSKLANFPLL